MDKHWKNGKLFTEEDSRTMNSLASMIKTFIKNAEEFNISNENLISLSKAVAVILHIQIK